MPRVRAALFDQTRTQLNRFGRTGFQRKNKGMGQVEAGGIHVATCLALIGGLCVKSHQCRLVIFGMCLQQELIQRGVTHNVVRPASTWLATQWWKLCVGPSITGEKRPPSNSTP